MLKDFFNKNKKVFAFLLAAILLVMTIAGIGIVSTRNNTAQMLNDPELQHQVVEIQEAVRNEILSTTDEIKYWTKEAESDSYTNTNKDNGEEYEKLVAFYSVDRENYLLTKTYYKYNSMDNTLKVAKVTQTLATDEAGDTVLHVDPYIDEAIEEIDTWEVVSENLENFTMDLSDFEETKQVSYEVKLKSTKVSFPAKDTVHVKSNVTINSNMIVDKHYTTLLAKPSLKPTPDAIKGIDGVEFIYDGKEHGPEIDDYIEEFITIEPSSILKETDAGTYTIVFKIKDKTKARWEDGTADDVVCTWIIRPKEIDLTWGQLSWIYDGQKHSTTCEIADGLVQGDTCEISLKNNSIGPNVGYKVCRAELKNPNYSIKKGSEKATLRITPATPSVDIDVVDKTYNGTEQNLVEYDNLIGGKLQYYVSTNDKTPSSEQVKNSTCKAKDAGKYHVWYKIVAKSNNYKDTEVIYAGVATIKRSATATAIASDKEYTGELLTGVTGEGVNLADDYQAINVGQYIAHATPDSNHLWKDGGTDEARELIWNINKAPGECEPPTGLDKVDPETPDDPSDPNVPGGGGNNGDDDNDVNVEGNKLVYNGENQVLVKPGYTPYGDVVYSLDGENWSKELPEGLDAGDYEVYYHSTGDENHEPTAPESIIVTIARARDAKVIPQDRIYNKEKQNGYSEIAHVALSGDYAKTSAREYVFTAVPDDNYAWEDGTVGEKKFTWTMHKAPGECEPPAGLDLTYNERSQTLIAPGSSKTGTVHYRIGDSGEWSAKLPKGMEAGEYKICYFSKGDVNHEDSAIGHIIVTIKKAPGACNPPLALDLTYNEDAQVLIVAGSTPYGEMQYKIGEDGEWSSEMPRAINAGDYKVYYHSTGDKNHEPTDKEAYITVTIKKAKGEITPPVAIDGLIYNGEDQILVEPGSTPYGEVMYSLDGENWSPELPKGLPAGDYEVYYYSTGDDNHEPTEPESIPVVISRSRTAYVLPIDRTYNEKEQNGYENYEHVVLSGDYAKTDAGVYTFKAIPDSNHAWENGEFGEEEFSWTMHKAPGECTAPNALDLTYNENAQTLIEAGSTPYGKVLYSLDKENWVEELPTGIDAGDYTVYYYSIGDNNHEPTSKDEYIVVTIKRLNTARITPVDSRVYNGTEQNGYSEKAHVILNGDSSAVNAKIYTYTAKPDSNHLWEDGTDIEIEFTWEMEKAPGLIELAEENGLLTYPVSRDVDIAQNISGGAVSVVSNDSDIATASASEDVLTLIPGTVGGTAVLTITSAETENYFAASTTYTVIVRNGQLGDIQSDGYTGVYDKQAHGISVSCATDGVTITYSDSQNGEYRESLTYADVGEYKVYYQVEKAGYVSVRGSERIIITKAPGSVELSETAGRLTYPNHGAFTVVENASGGELSITSSNTNVVNVELDGNTVNLIPGTTTDVEATITVYSPGGRNYTDAQATYTLIVEKGTLTNIVANGYDGIYDKAPHGITVSCPGATITYSTDGETYSATNPTYTDVSEHKVYYKVEKAGYHTATGDKDVIIRKAPGFVTLSSNGDELTYPNANLFMVTDSHGGDLSVGSSDNNIATASIDGTTVTVRSGTTAGTAVITVTSAATQNYTEGTATYTVPVKNGTITGVTARGYNGVYDRNAHSISVSCTIGGERITYSTSENGTYSETNPTFTDVGNYTVWYKIEKPGYTTVIGSETVVITPAIGFITLSTGSGTLTYPDANLFMVTDSHGGTLSVSSSNNNVATASIDGTRVTVRSSTTAGNATITVTSAATRNYTAASATYTVTVNSGTITGVIANGYDGVYDRNAHGISVRCNIGGERITYSISENGTYGTLNPIFADVGNYTVWYRIEADGYTTVTGRETVNITPADGRVQLATNSGALACMTSGSVAITDNLSGGTLSASSSNNSVATASINGTTLNITAGATSGTAVITVTSGATRNYTAASTTYTVTVSSGSMSATASNITRDFQEGVYSSITVNCSQGDATITYSTDGVSYSATNPSYTNAGTYPVYYRVTKPGYNTVEGSATITINKIAGSVKLSSYEGTPYPETGLLYFDVTENISRGALSVSSSNPSVKANIINSTVIVKSEDLNARATITVTSADTGNYKEAYAHFYVGPELVAQAIYSVDDGSLTFIRDRLYTAGETYNNKAVTAVYTGFETETYNYGGYDAAARAYIADTPWYENARNITSVVVEDQMNPVNTACWFLMFENCSSFDLKNLNTSGVDSMAYMFTNAGRSVTNLNMIGLSDWDTSDVSDMRSMFYYAGYNATTWSVDVSGWDTSSVIYMSSLFHSAGCDVDSWYVGDLGNWDVSSVRNMSNMFDCAGWFSDTWSIGDIGGWDVSNVESMYCMFHYAGFKTERWYVGDLGGWDVSNVNSMYGMFKDAGHESKYFNTGDLDDWDVSNVTNMYRMFGWAGAYTFEWNVGDLSKWDVSKVTNMHRMFICTGMNAQVWDVGNLDNWDVSNVEDMEGMFAHVGWLDPESSEPYASIFEENIATTFNLGNLSGWKTQKVTDMSEMFGSKTFLNYEMDLSGWDVSNVTEYGAFVYYGSTIKTPKFGN